MARGKAAAPEAAGLMVVIDGIRYRTEDAIRKGLIKVKSEDAPQPDVSEAERAAAKVVADRQAAEDARIKEEADAAAKALEDAAAAEKAKQEPAEKAAPAPQNKARTGTANK